MGGDRMVRAKIAYLIAEDPGAHGVLEAPQETLRPVYCEERSIGMQEAYQARATGLNPELKLILWHAFEYHGEKLIQYQGVRYNILRTYRDSDSIELTIQRVDGNAELADGGEG